MSSKSLLQTLVDQITKIDLHKTDRRAAVADKIETAMKRKQLNRVRFANMLGKQPSEITKWLSGYHNFTLDTLAEIECRLDVRLIDAEAHYQNLPRDIGSYTMEPAMNSLKQNPQRIAA